MFKGRGDTGALQRLSALACILALMLPMIFSVGAAASVTPIDTFPYTQSLIFKEDNTFVDGTDHILKFSFTLAKETMLHFFQTVGAEKVSFSLRWEGNWIAESDEVCLVLEAGNYELWILDNGYLANHTGGEMSATICVEEKTQLPYTVKPITLSWTDTLTFDEQNSFIHYDFDFRYRMMAFSFSLEEATAVQLTQIPVNVKAWVDIFPAGKLSNAIISGETFDIVLEAGNYDLWINDRGTLHNDGNALEADVSLSIISLSDMTDPIIVAIESYHHGGTGSLTATAERNAITVSGAVTGANDFELLIPDGVRVVWRAAFSGHRDESALMTISGNGTFEVADGAAISNSGNGTITLYGDTISLLVTGGSVKATGGSSMAIGASSLAVSGGMVSNEGTNPDDCAVFAMGIVAYLPETVKGNIRAIICVELDSLEVDAAWHGTNQGMRITQFEMNLTLIWDISGGRPFIVLRDSFDLLRLPWGYLKSDYTVQQHFGIFVGTGVRLGIVDAPSDRFKSLLLNNTEVDANNYAIEPGSTKIILSEGYLKTLANGDYTFIAIFEDGQVELTLTVRVIPATSDGGITLIWLLASGVALSVIGIAEMRRRKRAQ